TKAIDSVQKKYYDEDEQYEVQMDTKQIIHSKLEEEGCLHVPDVIDEVFREKPEFKEEVQEKLEKYHMEEASITPQNASTLRKYEKQYLSTDTGVEIKIPMEQYRDGESIEFITNDDGSISILIKNIGHITSKM
ncbi:MAG: nucleoid-associated protein, partial [Lachnospiraceae bacterium]|nr:nucleoid-associated protein [Lachnospiraceae bacterium]